MPEQGHRVAQNTSHFVIERTYGYDWLLSQYISVKSQRLIVPSDVFLCL